MVIYKAFQVHEAVPDLSGFIQTQKSNAQWTAWQAGTWLVDVKGSDVNVNFWSFFLPQRKKN